MLEPVINSQMDRTKNWIIFFFDKKLDNWFVYFLDVFYFYIIVSNFQLILFYDFQIEFLRSYNIIYIVYLPSSWISMLVWTFGTSDFPPRTMEFLVAFADGVTTAITKKPNNDNLVRETFDIASHFCYLFFWLQVDIWCDLFCLLVYLHCFVCVCCVFVCEMKENETEVCLYSVLVWLWWCVWVYVNASPCHRHLRGSAYFKLRSHQHVKWAPPLLTYVTFSEIRNLIQIPLLILIELIFL